MKIEGFTGNKEPKASLIEEDIWELDLPVGTRHIQPEQKLLRKN